MKRSIENKLKELCDAHTQLSKTIQDQLIGDSANSVLEGMWGDQLQSLENQIISTLKKSFEGKKMNVIQNVESSGQFTS